MLGNSNIPSVFWFSIQQTAPEQSIHCAGGAAYVGIVVFKKENTHSHEQSAADFGLQDRLM